MHPLCASLIVVLTTCLTHDGAGEPLPLTLAWRELEKADTHAAREEEDAEVQRAVAQALDKSRAAYRMRTCAEDGDWRCCTSAAEHLIDLDSDSPEAHAYVTLASQALHPSRDASVATAVAWVSAETDGLVAAARYDDAIVLLELFSRLDPVQLAAKRAGVQEQARQVAADAAVERALTCLGAGDRACFQAEARGALQLSSNADRLRWLPPLLSAPSGDDGLREASAKAQRLAEAARWVEAIALLELVIELDPAHDAALRQTRAAYQERLAAMPREKLWRSRCAPCHGRDGAARTRTGQRYDISSMADPAWHDRWSDASIERAIRHGVAGTPMRAFAHRLTADEIAALVMHIRTFRPP